MQPYFGMFGYGGPIASMHLGRYELLKNSESYLQPNKGIILVYAMVLQACYSFLQDKSVKESVYITSRKRGFTQLFLFWKDLEGVENSSLSPLPHPSHCLMFLCFLSDLQTNGGLRDPLDCEIQESPHGSFTKVTFFPFSLQFKSVLSYGLLFS